MRNIDIELVLSYKCNQDCFYCFYSKNTDSQNNYYESDIDLIKFILLNLNNCNLYVTLTGGEPGLCTDIVKVCDTILNIKNVINLSIHSNGLIRKTNVDLSNPRILYYEHLIKDAKDNKLIKMYPEMELFDENTLNYRNIIITSEGIVDYFLNNLEELQEIRKFSRFKILNPHYVPHIQDIDLFLNKLYLLSTIIKSNYNLYVLENYKDKRINGFIEKCFKLQQKTISLPEKIILHCSGITDRKYSKDITKTNLSLLKRDLLFTGKYSDYPHCLKCHNYHIPRYYFTEK